MSNKPHGPIECLMGRGTMHAIIGCISHSSGFTHIERYETVNTTIVGNSYQLMKI